MELSPAFVRLLFYGLFLLWAFLLLAICAVRLNYTLNLSSTDPLNGGRRFYDPSVAELLSSAICGIIFAPFMMLSIITQFEGAFLSRVWFELVSLTFLWLLWIGGAAAATDVWPANLLAGCTQFSQCRTLQALLAFAWLGFLTLTILLLGTLYLAVRYQAWSEHSHGRWMDDDSSQIQQNQSQQKGASAPFDYGRGGVSLIPPPRGANAATTNARAAAPVSDYIVYDSYDASQPQRYPQQQQQQAGAVRLSDNYV